MLRAVGTRVLQRVGMVNKKCEHGRHNCKDCGGSGICEHGRGGAGSVRTAAAAASANTGGSVASARSAAAAVT